MQAGSDGKPGGDFMFPENSRRGAFRSITNSATARFVTRSCDPQGGHQIDYSTTNVLENTSTNVLVLTPSTEKLVRNR